MSRQTEARDVTLSALALLTGGLTAAALVGTGLVTGLAAEHTAQKTQAKAASTAAAAAALAAPARLDAAGVPKPAPRPTRTVVTTRYVQAQTPAGQVQVSQPQSVGSGSYLAPRATRSSGTARAGASAYVGASAPVRAPAPVRAFQPAPPAPSAAS